MPTSASDLYKAGQLREAIDAQVLEVKAKPADQARRLFLFELLAFSGDIDRARKQIDAVTYDDPKLNLGVVEYRALLDSEVLRRKVFAEGTAPVFLGKPAEHLVWRLEASSLLRQGRAADAAKLIDQANDAVPPFGGAINGKPFTHLRDADDLFAGVLEVMAKGQYLWVPLEQVVSLATNPPRFPRDLVYMPARIQVGAETGEVFLPCLYPGSHLHADDAIRLGRMTDWSPTEDGPVLGVGTRLFIGDDEPVSLVDLRQYLRGELGEAPAG